MVGWRRFAALLRMLDRPGRIVESGELREKEAKA
jgi:hypothetical protein